MSRKVITLALSLFVLAVLPLVSLYYSFQGAALRKHAMAELGPKESLPEAITKSIKPGPNLYLFSSNCTDTSILKPLINQFKDEKIRFVFIGDSLYQSKLAPLKIVTLKPEGLIQNIDFSGTVDGIPTSICNVILTNSHFQVLHRYDLSQALERTNIIEHLALLVTKK